MFWSRSRHNRSRVIMALVATILSLAPFGVLRAEGEAPKVGDTAADFELRSVLGNPVRLSETLKPGKVVLVVLRGYPGYQCPLCHRQVAELIKSADQFQKAGAQVLLVYPGPPKNLAARAREFIDQKEIPKNFTLLLDPQFKFTLSYGLRWEAPNETAYPSTFVLEEKTGKISYALISKTHGGRAPTADVLKAVEQSAGAN